MIIERSLFCF